MQSVGKLSLAVKQKSVIYYELQQKTNASITISTHFISLHVQPTCLLIKGGEEYPLTTVKYTYINTCSVIMLKN